MPLNTRFGISCSFSMIENILSTEELQEAYYIKWREKYAIAFNKKDNFTNALEWDLRCRKAMREIFTSATLYVEAKKNLEMKCFSSYYFCLYYSLFHAIYSCIYLDVESSIEQLTNVTHNNIINIFISAFANTEKDIFDRDIKSTFEDLRYKREYYSYSTPFNNIFDYSNDLKNLENIIKKSFQLASFHTLIVEKSYDKNIKSTFNCSNLPESRILTELFYKLFAKRNKSNIYILDDSCKNMLYELKRYGLRPSHIVTDLEHQFDEYHTYDSFYNDDFNENQLNILDIWAFIYNALI